MFLIVADALAAAQASFKEKSADLQIWGWMSRKIVSLRGTLAHSGKGVTEAEQFSGPLWA